MLIEEISKDELIERLNKFVEFEVSDLNQAVKILKDVGLNEAIDFRVINDETLQLYSNLELRDKFNSLFVNSGIDVRKVNLCEENLEDFFTRMVSNN